MSKRNLYPKDYVDSTYAIDFKKLYEQGYRGVIFDVDNTLTDYDYTNRYAISRVFNEAGKCMREADYNNFKRFEIDYWRQFENSSQEMDTHGFSRIDYVRSHIYQEYFGEDVISLEFGYHLMNVYINNLGVINKVYDGVPETLEYLYHKYRLYIASNGPQESQIRKLVNTNLNSFSLLSTIK